jgi:hypothetical protein
VTRWVEQYRTSGIERDISVFTRCLLVWCLPSEQQVINKNKACIGYDCRCTRLPGNTHWAGGGANGAMGATRGKDAGATGQEGAG